MSRLIISGLVSAALLAVATGAMRSHSHLDGGTVGQARASASQDSASVAQAGQLPVQDFEDRSLVFPRDVKP
ncbi:hypothetical protein JQ596_00380 [Bradyrhizobium manausense]|uniref:hypothetical protein n=1 Tax=Bradyrhizobium TaxID=374 RepID=UPI001BAA3188|nr:MULTISPECIES: hypothetical protein [Bradyrhizobium]MBR0823969.1 hypothetical protein [Bradyrhizobium manausense]UVO26384.1 hypothetical protein KUF59_27985 [Bradyrhizobium arachidis]